MTNDRLLRIYLNDHFGAAAAGRELVARALANNGGSAFESKLEDLLGAIEEDRNVLERIIGDVGGNPDAIKKAAGWIAEKVGRLKLNGQIRGYSPLSRLLELEGLATGVEAKMEMWRALRLLSENDPRLDAAELDGLIERGLSQRDSLERMRLEAAVIAFKRDP